MRRVLVIGVSGAGKSTLAKRIAERTTLPYVATDPFYWEPGWRCAAAQQVRQKVDEATSSETWVLDGNFDEQRALVWRRADTVIWLDFPLAVVLRRVCYRNFKWAITQEVTWSGNRMSLGRAWSGVRHCLCTYGRKRRDYPRYLAAFSHLHVLHFRSPSVLAEWLGGLSFEEVFH